METEHCWLLLGWMAMMGGEKQNLVYVKGSSIQILVKFESVRTFESVMGENMGKRSISSVF
jgi:hypothetical protein